MAKEINVGGRKCLVFPPKETSEASEKSLIIVNGNSQMADIMVQNKLLPRENCCTVIIFSENWSDDFTPWPADALNPKFAPFGGKADSYIMWMKNELIPYIKENFTDNSEDVKIGMLGQSLSGLFNFYLNIKEPQLFSFAACISASTWFDGWIEYFEKSIKEQKKKSWYISCGLKEGTRCRDLRSKTLETTKKTLELLRENGHEAEEYWDNGDHLNHLTKRIENALNWLSQKLK